MLRVTGMCTTCPDARQRMINRRGAAPTGGNATPLNNHCGRPCAGRFVLAPLSGGARRSAAPPCPRPAVAAAEMNSHTKRGGDFVGQVCPTKSTFCMAGRPRYRARCCWGCRVPVRRAPARPARRAPRPSGAAGALGRARALRWGTAGGVPPPAGGGGALRPRAFGAQATHADARFARDRSVRKIKNARIRKHVHKIAPCHFRGHALCWKLQGTPFPLQIARASCGSRIQEEPPNRAALSLS